MLTQPGIKLLQLTWLRRESMAVSGKKATKQFSPSATSMGSDKELKVYCQPCARDGPRLPAHGYCTNCAEHLCETCFTLHRRHTLSRNHTLLDKANMPQAMSAVTASVTDTFTQPCSKHNIEMIKYYCHDHEALLCSVCVTLEHTRTSCKVNYIPDISGQVIKGKEYQATLKAIDGMKKEASKTLQDINKANNKSNKSLTDALADIKKFRTKINQRLDELEKQIKKTAIEIREENSRNMTRIEKECSDISKYLDASSDTITHLNTSKQANELFMELKQVGQMIEDYEKKIVKLTIFDVKKFKFEPNKAIKHVLSKERTMGTLKGLRQLKSRQLSHKDKICIKTSNDSTLCDISGMTLLTPNLLIITDYDNMVVKMVDISKMSVVHREELDSKPLDVSSVSQDEIAVTMPFKTTIQFMMVSRNKLKKKQSIKVYGICCGISCHKDKMVVSFTDPGTVQILLINGTVLHTIQGETIFKNPDCVTTSYDYIYVSDKDMKTIIKLNWQGEVKDRYDCRSKPNGLTMSRDGTVFVCYYDNTMSEISEEFTDEQTVIEDIHDPLAVCWSDQTCTLYTSSCSGDKENDNFIKIFNFLG